MSEESPSFKITDRRLFNPDGTLRQPANEEETRRREGTPPVVAETGTRVENAGAAAASAQSTTTNAAPAPHEKIDEAAASTADPTPFVNLLMFIASPAAAALGLSEHPSLPPGEVDLPLAKHCIDLLATLKEKTRGNLTAQEQQMFENLLAELRMQYVSLTSAPRRRSEQNFGGGTQGLGGFSGSDITGGR
jgi:hypothetical protein